MIKSRLGLIKSVDMGNVPTITVGCRVETRQWSSGHHFFLGKSHFNKGNCIAIFIVVIR